MAAPVPRKILRRIRFASVELRKLARMRRVIKPG
jgi:hypothetical protein